MTFNTDETPHPSICSVNAAIVPPEVHVSELAFPFPLLTFPLSHAPFSDSRVIGVQASTKITSIPAFRKPSR